MQFELKKERWGERGQENDIKRNNRQSCSTLVNGVNLQTQESQEISSKDDKCGEKHTNAHQYQMVKPKTKIPS